MAIYGKRIEVSCNIRSVMMLFLFYKKVLYLGLKWSIIGGRKGNEGGFLVEYNMSNA